MYATAFRIPKGLITQWFGSIANIPSGWALCDGQNGSIDLRDKFIVCARQDVGIIPKTLLTGSLTQFGGNVNHIHTAGEVQNVQEGTDFECWDFVDSNPNSVVSVPYYALAFIQKL